LVIEHCLKYSDRVIFLKTKADTLRLAAEKKFPRTISHPHLAMMLNDLVNPIITAINRHAARLQLLAKTKRSRTSEVFREESARICENDIQNIVQSGYQATIDPEPDPTKKVRLLADAQKQLKDLVYPRLPQVGNRPDDGYYSIFIEGSVDAARTVYAKIFQESAPFTARQLVAHLTSLADLDRASEGLAAINHKI
jgi:hypothetical protein